jgi:hypothetical protein
VAPVVEAGNGLQTSGPWPAYTPPPVPEPTHWLTVAAPLVPPGVPALMLFVTVTVHVTSGGAASLAEPLHWAMLVTRLLEVVVNDPFPGGHGPSEHWRVTVVLEPTLVPLMVLTTVTVQVRPVVAPSRALTALHWSMLRFAACAGWAAAPAQASANAAARRKAAKHLVLERNPEQVIMSILDLGGRTAEVRARLIA